MKLKFLFFVSLLGLSSAVNAGTFDSKEEKLPFKCGREDAISALTEALRDNALSKISISPDKLERFQNQVEKAPVSISDVSTTNDSSQELKCVATVSMTVPVELKELAEKAPEVFSEFIRESHGLYKNGNLIWNGISYKVRLADNEKDISVALGDTYYVPMSLAKASYLSITKDDIIQRNNPSRVTIAKQAYEAEDARLNKIWKAIPSSFRASMKNEQISWIWQKENNCGNIESANNVNLSISGKVELYECQTEMTKARIKYLSGQQ
ncbi:DUF1311 domain-containing protein [Aeromonas popoffii]|uniref:DUF1311 domain-containing protein n=1 Tax=Aeromonas popoffii TaxID=70856 RepID=A0ABS5GWR1_9GAMM|nr:lysozyme inhibitor LprI family protein [Aeromonas popoffii]MBR7631585.1 DUF1311 domain-containing protein [Aeromonas popoffii]